LGGGFWFGATFAAGMAIGREAILDDLFDV
jgi:hypothetical protein